MDVLKHWRRTSPNTVDTVKTPILASLCIDFEIQYRVTAKAFGIQQLLRPSELAVKMQAPNHVQNQVTRFQLVNTYAYLSL